MTAPTTDRRITDGWMGVGDLLALGERVPSGGADRPGAEGVMGGARHDGNGGCAR